MKDRRFIEESFPVKEVSAISAREKSIRHGHISTLHIWWARRPLAASRATAYAALSPASSDIETWQRKRDFIVDLSKWENALDQRLLDKAHAQVTEANEGKVPRVLDPFAGGGSYPLEALRLGCESHASDSNPVAVLLLKATLEYPWRFGRPTSGEDGLPEPLTDLFGSTLSARHVVNPLLKAVIRSAKWVLEEASKELAAFYPADPDGSVPVAYLWARTIPCQNPTCHAEIPLMRQFWLLKRERKRVALYPVATAGGIKFHIVGNGYEPWPDGFDPERGTVSRAVSTCLCCGATIDEKITRRLFQDGKAGQRLVAVVLSHRNQKGKIYRPSTPDDVQVFSRADVALQTKRERLALEWGGDPVPDEPLGRVPVTFGVINVWVYGINTWGELFNSRQKLALITFADKMRQACDLLASEGADPEFVTAVATYLALGVDRLADKNANVVVWDNTRDMPTHVFARTALPMVWDYAETNVLNGGTGDWNSAMEWIGRVIEHCSNLPHYEGASPVVKQASATSLEYPDDYFDAVLTDPPYYDNVPYSYLSDFFYVWLKRTVGHRYPDLFATPLTPKATEIVAYTQGSAHTETGKQFFETNLKKAFQEVHRVLKPNGMAVIVYAHKSTAGWETVINALLDSGLVITGAWPLNTEMQTRLRATESAALASSIFIAARKMARQPTGFFGEVRDEVRHHLDTKLQRLWDEGIGGADFFIAAIGSAIEVLGKYEQVLDYEGNVVRADRLLEDVRTIATDYAVRQILHDGFAGEISDLTRFYVLWRWEYGEARVPFDEARKLAQSCGLDISREWGKGKFIRKDKEFVQVLGPQVRKLEDLDDSHEMIDVLHRVLLLWEKSQRAEIVSVLAASGYGASEAFYRVAQAISETLPNESKEKKLLDGFLAGRGRVRDEVEQAVRRPTLWQE
jgi:putative DNA methylase